MARSAGRPASWPSSSPLGLMRSGADAGSSAARAARGSSEVSTAMRSPGAASRRRPTRRAYHLAGAPGGREPDRTAQWWVSAPADTPVRVRVSRRACSTASISSSLRPAPSSLSLVVVPSGSVTAVLMRAGPATGTDRTVRPGSSRAPRAVRMGSFSAAGRTAVAARPALDRTRATLTPLPPGSMTTPVRRWTAPRWRGPGRETVRSRDGLGVRVRIMRQGPRFRWR